MKNPHTDPGNSIGGLILKAVLVFVFILTVAIILYGCDDFVEVDLPDNQLTSETVFEDQFTATAAMTDIYSKIRDNGLLAGTPSGLSNQLGHYADELDYYGDVGGSTLDFYNNSLLASNFAVTTLWNDSYSQIYAANAVIEGVDNSESLPEGVRQQLKGEALFTRALIHFYLVNLFGNIPYVTGTDYEINSHVGRLPVTDVYAFLIADLEQAVTFLPSEYITEDRVRPNSFTAQALLARVYLYSGAWGEAANAASAVINNGTFYELESDLNSVFLKESTGTIWQLMPSDGMNTQEGLTFIFTAGPPPLTALSEELLSSFEPGDQRRENWVAEVTDGTTSWYHANKYKLDWSAAGFMEYSILFRLEEQYLIRAEARARQGEVSGAKDDLNLLKQRAGLPETTAVTPQEIISAIEQEGRVEFFTEFGHRFFDLKRYSTINEVLSAVKPGWDSHEALWPIPQNELLANPNLLPQNGGY